MNTKGMQARPRGVGVRRARQFGQGLARHVIALFWLAAGPALADSVDYSYDELGRLIQAANTTSGQAIQYAYDAAGNITTVNTVALTSISVAGFSPSAGAPGTQVTITGTGFNTTPASNTVKFNGQTATVSSATSSKLVASVPSGATSGPISVTNGANTGSSSTNFVVRASDAPTITGFSPAVGGSGTSVTITGTNFDVEPTKNRVTLNQRPVEVVSATASTLVVTIPSTVASGRFQIITPTGEVTSSQAFAVPPPGYASSQIASAQEIPLNGTAPGEYSFSSPKDTVLLFFDGADGMKDLRVITSGVTGTGATLTTKVFDPANNLIASATTNPARLDLPTLARNGTYTVAITDTYSSGTIKATMTQAKVLGEFEPDWGNGNDYSTTIDGNYNQVGLLSFNGVEGEVIQVKVDYSGDRVKIGLRDPAGASVWQSSVITADTTLTLPELQSTGTYYFVVDPETNYHAEIRYIAGVIPSPTLNFGSDAVIAMGEMEACCGPKARITFQGQAGQSVAIRGSSRDGYMTEDKLFYYPNGSGSRTYVSQCCVSERFEYLVRELPATATYYFQVEGSSSGSTIADVRLDDGTAGSLSVNGSALSVTKPYPYQLQPFYFLNFDGSASQAMSISTNVGSNGCPKQDIHLIDPSDKVVKVVRLVSSTKTSLGTLASSGPYRLAVVAYGQASYTPPYDAPNVYHYAAGSVAGSGTTLSSELGTNSATCNYTLTSP